MAERTLLVTGLGGAGRTTVAAATALAATRRGDRTLLLSTDPSVDLVLGTRAGRGADAPARVADGLWAARVDTAEHFRTEFLALQDRLTTALDLLGAPRLRAEELTELPGGDSFAALHALRTAARGDWDVLVVDLPPLPAALALLALPEQLRRYLRRLLPRERQAARALRPIMAQLAGVPMPARWLYEAAERRDGELAEAQALVEAPGTAVRVVAEPGPAADRALRGARAGLALHGLRIDALVANKVLPGDTEDRWLAGLAGQQRKGLDGWHGDPGTWPAVHELPHLGRDPLGTADLADLAAPPPHEHATGPDAAHGEPWRVEDRLARDGLLVWCLPLPCAAKNEIGLVRREHELMVSVGPFRRVVPLAPALRRCTVDGAALTDGVLRVRFAPDPAQWPRGGPRGAGD